MEESREFAVLTAFLCGAVWSLDVEQFERLVRREKDSTGLRRYLGIPNPLRPMVMSLLEKAASQDDLPPGAEPLARDGKWHRAVNNLQARMREYAKATGMYLPLGDWSFAGLMDVAADLDKPRRGDYPDFEYPWWVQ